MDNKNFYNEKYMPKVNRIGKITGYLGVVLAFAPAVMLAVVYGILPKGAALLTAFIAGASSFGVLWFVEPISYFPVVGSAGTYRNGDLDHYQCCSTYHRSYPGSIGTGYAS